MERSAGYGAKPAPAFPADIVIPVFGHRFPYLHRMQTCRSGGRSYTVPQTATLLVASHRGGRCFSLLLSLQGYTQRTGTERTS